MDCVGGTDYFCADHEQRPAASVNWQGEVNELEYAVIYERIDAEGRWVWADCPPPVSWSPLRNSIQRAAMLAAERADRRSVSIGARPSRDSIDIKHYDPEADLDFLDDATITWRIDR